MVEFKRKNKNSFWYSPIFLAVLFLLFIYFAYKVFLLARKYRESVNNKEIVSNELVNLVERKDALAKDIAKMRTKEGIEEIIRNKYQVVKKGEKMVVIVGEDNDSSLNKNMGSPTSHNFWKWLKNIFK